MTNEVLTPEKVQELYSRYYNKQQFLILFGTTKFHLVDVDFLKRMYSFLKKTELGLPSRELESNNTEN